MERLLGEWEVEVCRGSVADWTNELHCYLTLADYLLQYEAMRLESKYMNATQMTLLIAAALLYVAPVLVAAYRRVRYWWLLGMINLLLGWTVIGWLIAYVWAVMGESHPHRKPHSRIYEFLAAYAGPAGHGFWVALSMTVYVLGQVLLAAIVSVGASLATSGVGRQRW